MILLLLSAYFAIGANAAGATQGPKASKSAKSMKKEAPPAVRRELEPKAVEILKADSSRQAPLVQVK